VILISPSQHPIRCNHFVSSTAPGTAAVSVGVERFEGSLSRYALIEASWRFEFNDATRRVLLVCRTSAYERAGDGYAGVVNAYRRAVIVIADQIATVARESFSGSVAACPSVDRPDANSSGEGAGYRRVSGLGEEIAPGREALARGMLHTPGGWRLAQDPATFARRCSVPTNPSPKCGPVMRVRAAAAYAAIPAAVPEHCEQDSDDVAPADEVSAPLPPREAAAPDLAAFECSVEVGVLQPNS